MEHCSGIPGIVYNFKNQNLMTFEDNLGYKGDSVVAYIDFDPKIIIFAFHPTLKMDRIIIQRNFGHSLE